MPAQTLVFTATVPGTFTVTFDVGFEPAPDPDPPPPPPPPAITRSYHRFTSVNSYLGAQNYTHQTVYAVPGDFEAVALVHENVQPVEAIVTNHCVAGMASLAEGLQPSGPWVDGPAGVAVPAAYDAPGVLYPGLVVSAEIPLAAVAPADAGRFRYLAARTCRVGHYQPHIQPSGYTAAEWEANNPRTPLKSWVRGGNIATAAAAAATGAAGWSTYNGVLACGGIMLRHARQVASVLDIGDSTRAGALAGAVPVTNLQSLGFRAVRKLVAEGAELGYLNMAMSGAGWPRIRQQAEKAVTAGIVRPNTIALLQTYTVNSAMSAAQHWAEAMATKAILQAAGATVILTGPMLGANVSQTVLDVRAQGLAQTLCPYLDISAVIGQPNSPSQWGAGMAWDDSHPSPAAMGLLGDALATILDGVLA